MEINSTSLINILSQQLTTDQTNVAQLQTQMASGKLLNSPSDNPNAVTQVMALSAQASQLSSWESNAGLASSWLDTASSTINSVLNAMQSARTLLLQAANQASQSSTTYPAIGKQLQGVVSTLNFLSNTQYEGRPIFGGTSASPQAYDSAGNYLGNIDAPTVVIGPGAGVGQTVPISVTGTQVFGSGSSNVFATLTTVANDLLSGSPTSSQINAALNALDSNISSAGQASVVLGNSSQEVSGAVANLTNQLSSVKATQASLQDVNVASATTQLDAEMTNYQAALWAASRAIPETLAKFVAP